MADRVSGLKEAGQTVNIDSGIRIIDCEFNTLFSNSQANRILGNCTGNKCYSFNTRKIDGSGKSPCKGCPCATVLDGKKLVRQAIISTSSVMFPCVEVTCTPVKDAHGNIVGAVETIHAICSENKSGDDWDHAIDSISASVCILDAHGKIIRCNEAMSRLVGKPITEIIQNSCCFLIHGQENPINNCPLERMKKTMKKESSDLKVNGRWFSATAEPLFDCEGKIYGAVHIIQDIHEQKNAEEENKYCMTVMRNISDTVITTDLNFIITGWNNAAENMLGWKLPEVIGKPLTDVITNEFQNMNSAQARKILFSKGMWSGEVRQTTKDGRKINVLVSVSLIRDFSGEPIGIVAVHKDITDRKNAEEALRISEQGLRRAQQFSHVGSWEWNIKTGKVKWSDEMYSLFGITKKLDEVDLNKIIESSIHPDDLEKVRQSNMLVAIKKRPHPIYYRVIWPDNSVHFIWAEAGEFILDESGKPHILRGYAQDITERKMTEDALRRSEEKYRKLVNNSLFGVFQSNIRGEILFANQALIKLAGFTEFQSLAKEGSLARHFTKEQRKRFIDNLKKEGFVKNLEIITRAKDGSLRRGIVNAELEGEIISGMVLDITDQKKAEEALEAVQVKFLTVFNNAPVLMAISEVNSGKFIEANQEYLSTLGYTREEVIGNTSMQLGLFVDPAQRESLVAIMRKDGIVNSMEVRVRTKAGNVRDVLFSAKPIPAGDEECWLTTAKDITELKRYQESLQHSQQHLQNVFNSASEAMISLDNNLVITAWNPAAVRMFGYKKSEMIGANICNIAGFSSISSLVKSAESSSQSDVAESDVKTKDGRSIRLISSISILREANGSAEGVLVVSRPITYDARVHNQISPGNTYLVREKERDAVQRSYGTFLEQGRSGIFITRDNPADVKSRFPSSDVLWLTTARSAKIPSANNPDDVLKWVSKHCRHGKNTVIFLDRTEYLITIHGFTNVLKMIYSINDLVLQTDSIAFISVDSSTVTEQQMKMLCMEMSVFTTAGKSDITLPNEHIDILQFVNNRNSRFTEAYFKDVSRDFGLSKATTKKIITSLMSQGLLSVRKIGRLKAIDITEEGKKILSLSREHT